MNIISRFRNRNKPSTQEITKAASENATIKVPERSLGSDGRQMIKDLVDILAEYDLRYPECLRTFDLMKKDETIATGLLLQRMLASKAFVSPKFSHSKNPKSEEASKFLEYMFKNMEKPLDYYMREAISGYGTYGFSIHYKVAKKYQTGEHKGKLGWHRLSWRDPRSLDHNEPFVYGNRGRTIKKIRQNMQAFNNSPMGNRDLLSFQIQQGESGVVEFPYNRCVVYGKDFTAANPLGDTPLYAAYKAWKEKTIIADYQLVGITKDLGGLIEITLPAEIMDKAYTDPASKEAAFLEQYKQNAANAHAGEQAYVMLPSDLNEGGGKQYSMSLKGIEGGGKQYSTTEVIKDLRKTILDLFGAGFLVVGTENAGSYNLAESGISLHGQFIEDDVNHCRQKIDRELIPQILAANGFLLNEDDTPKIVTSPINPYDQEGTSKAVQRMRATNSIVLTKTNIIDWHKRAGYPTDHMEEMTQEELIELLSLPNENMESKSGSGMTSGLNNGQGSKIGTQSGSDDANTSNLEKSSFKVISSDDTVTILQIGEKILNIPTEDLSEFDK